MAERYFVYFLIISPLIFLTGGVDHVTPLSIANYLHLPSLAPLTYIVFLAFVMTILLGKLGSVKKLLYTFAFFITILLVCFRSDSLSDVLISFVSQLIILSPLLALLSSPVVINNKNVKKISNAYIFFLILSVVLHFVFLQYSHAIGVIIPNDRAVGIFKNPNHLSAFAILTLLVFYHLKNISVYKVKYVFPVECLVALTVILSGSRSSLLFLVLVLIIHSWAFNKRVFTYYCIMGFFGVLFVFMSDVGINKIEALLAKRDTTDIQNAGNMRMLILFETIKGFDLYQIVFGKGSGQGTTVFITSQAAKNEQITWLDSNINTLVYTYGALFTAVLYLSLIIKCSINYLNREFSSFLATLYLIFFMWFFNVGEFFPLIFIVLILVGKKNENLIK